MRRRRRTSRSWFELEEDCEDIEGAVGCMTDYLNFCMAQVVPVKTVRCFSNNKPWITCEVKAVLNQKKRAFRSRNYEEMRKAQKELKICLKKVKDAYRRKLEIKLKDNMQEVWNGIKTITGYNSKGKEMCRDLQRADELNTFINRFSSPMTTSSPLQPSSSHPPYCHYSIPPPVPCPLSPSCCCPPTPPPSISANQVRTALRPLHPRKAAGPDRVCPRLLKACAAELGHPLQQVYNLSLRLGESPFTVEEPPCIMHRSRSKKELAK